MLGLTLGLTPALGAQTVGVAFAPGCGPGTGCGTLRFAVGAPPAGLALATLALTVTGGPYRFAPNAPGAPSVGTYAARDDLGPFGGFTAVGPGGVRLFADFVDTGDPANPGFPFTLGGGSVGTFEVDVAPAADGTLAFAYEAALAGGGTIAGTVAVIPEPATGAYVAAGLLGAAGARRVRVRRRAHRGAAPIR